MPTPIESIIMAFMMSNGDLNGVWQSLPFTSHSCNRKKKLFENSNLKY